jgi:hypothetical protein
VCHDAVSRAALEALRGKYQEMLRMRLDDEAHPGSDTRREMAALAARFPGALRELDEAPLDVIRERIRALSRCVDSGAPVEPWMHASAVFHSLTRGALAAKRWLAGRRVVDDALVAEFLIALAGSPHGEDARAWTSDLALVAAPPGGKLTELVFARVAVEMGVSVDEARELVIGPPKGERSLRVAARRSPRRSPRRPPR